MESRPFRKKENHQAIIGCKQTSKPTDFTSFYETVVYGHGVYSIISSLGLHKFGGAM